MKRLLPVLLFVFLVLNACHKEQKRLNFDLTVTDQATGQPLRATVVLKYSPFEGQSATEYLTLGTTDASGQLKIDQKADAKMFNPELQITAEGEYGAPGSNFPDAYLDIETGKDKRNYSVMVTPTYYALVKLRNINCQDETDSVWLSNNIYPNTRCYTGCIDGVLGSTTTPWTNWTTRSSITYNVKVKRDGLTYDFDKTFELVPGEVKLVEIEY